VSFFDAAAAWQLSDDVSLRDEPFGALAYHHGNRRLVFLKSPELVTIVRQLADFTSARDAIAAHVAPTQIARYESALATLVPSEIIHGR
jgi:putative mycofactocin binding protein MftB